MSNQDENDLDASGFEWDENKRQSNIAKHGIDFEDILPIFYSPHLDFALKFEKEPRRQATGMIGELCFAVIYTMRGTVVRIISTRRARKNEERAYREIHGRGDP
ncbi:MAG: BrnT family toxin [Ancalomicrobiaceae bacterium]|nr:BrnT family toxin [Ancalomicrobiaceae bacterium]